MSNITHIKLLFKKYSRQINKGTTLIELLLYMGLLTLFIGVLSSLFGTAIDIHLASQSNTGITIDTTYILSKLKYDIQRADQITTPAANGDSAQSLVLVIDGVTHTYSMDITGNLNYTNNLGTNQLTSYLATISSLSFTKIGNIGGNEPTIKIDITINSRVNQLKGIDSQTISTTIAQHSNQ